MCSNPKKNSQMPRQLRVGRDVVSLAAKRLSLLRDRLGE